MIDRDFIDDLAKREHRKAEQVADGLRRRDWKGPTSITPFYPELQRTEGAHVTAVPGVSVGNQVPLFGGAGLLVQIEPFTTPATFEEHYGINVATMRDLVQRRLVIPIISSDLHRYIGLDYLAPLLTMEPTIVASVRTHHFFLLQSTAYETYIEEGQQRLTMLYPQARDWERKYRTGGEAFVTARAKRYARLKVLHPEVSERIEEAIKNGPEATRSVIDMLDMVLVDRHTSAFEGTLSVDGTELRQAIQNVPEVSPPSVVSAFYSQLAENVLDYVGLSFPQQLTLRQLDDLQRTDLPRRAQEVLRAMNEAVTRESDSVSHRASDIVEYWTEVNQRVSAMTKSKDTFDNMLVSGSIAVTGGATWIATENPNAGVGVSLATKAFLDIPLVKQVRTALAEQAVTFLKPKVPTLIFELKRDAEEFRSGR